MLVYKIRRKSDGLFSQGGNWPDFSKLGKIWKTKGHLTNHLKQVRHSDYEDCEIVPYAIVEIENSPLNLKEFFLRLEEERKVKNF
ncbi:MAG TPA: hypothetical protein PLP33_14630 [Leptospiraceae bacterium]|nr:hypothetical protein [Leptospiraceae bacterium]